MCIYREHVHMYTTYEVLRLNLWLGEVYTDDDDANIGKFG